MAKHKLIFVGLYDETNFGDPIIAYCTEWLYSQHIQGDFEAIHLSLDYIKESNLPKPWRGIRKILRLLHLNWVKYNEIFIQKQYIKYYKKNIKTADLIIVVGGGLIKYTYQYFHPSLDGLMVAAERCGIPVVLNSVGVEGYDGTNKKCLALKSVLHKKALRHISTRDDIKTLYNSYYDGKPSIPCVKVADPAVWAAEAYGITRSHSDIIGIGIGRGRLFIDNGKDFSDKQFFVLYIQLIETLSKQGKQVELFTNGLDADNEFACQILKEMRNRNIDIILRIPDTSKEMIENIASYRCIIAARLHSCIVAYSLGIPAIGFVWNDKLKLWGRNIDAEDFFIQTENLNTDYVLTKLERLQDYHYPTTARDKFRDTINNTINDIVKHFVSERTNWER